MKKRIPGYSTSRRIRCALGSIVAAVALGGCLTAGVAFADTVTDIADVSEGLPVYLQSGLYSDQETDDTMSTLAKAAYPSTFDLRHYNGTVTYDAEAGKSVITGGTNYVSPVKLQNPFGSCWAFSICAAAETSLLTSLDKADDGALNGTVDYEKAASGEAGNVAYNASNISERALAYSIFTYPKSYGIYSSQAGEGYYFTSGVMGDGASILNNGGMPYSGISTFSCGIGPTPEAVAPYISDEGWVEVYIPELDPTSDTPKLKTVAFTNLKKAIDFAKMTWTDQAIEEVYKKYDIKLTKEKTRPFRSSKGTWSVDSENLYGTIAELDQSNILEITKGDGLSSDEISAMKQELLEGRAITIAFCADQSRPGQAISANNSYMNTDNWAQYTYETKRVNHAVTIVGYDDDYAASNFTHNQYKVDETTGELVVDEEKTALTTPEGNGAWIVKNSWGTTDTDELLDQNEWGVDGSGYFYLSYYDKNIGSMESYEFDTSQEAQERSSYETSQYDVSKASQTTSTASNSIARTCNVFDGPEKGNNPIAIRDLGCITGAVDDNVTLDVYVMDDADDPATVIAQGNPTATVSAFYDKSGFHRLHLDDAIIVGPDKKVAIVQTTRRVDGKYEVACQSGFNQEFVVAYNTAHTSTILPSLSLGSISSYLRTVVNEGESLIYCDGEWEDWSEARSEYALDATRSLINAVRGEASNYETLALYYKMIEGEDSDNYKAFMEIAENCKNFSVDEPFAYDNFSIKLYGDDAEAFSITEQPQSATAQAGDTVTMSVSTTGAVKSYQWQHSKDGVTWSNTKWAGYDTSEFSFKMLAALDARQWRCVVTFADGTQIASDAATTSLQAAVGRITEQPASTFAFAGQTATMKVATEGVEVASYQWQHSKDGVKWSSTAWSTTDELSFKMLTALADRQWRCVVTFADGTSATSNAATSYLLAQPEAILAEATAAAGEDVGISVLPIEGATYQWQHSKDGKTWSDTKWAGYDDNNFGFKMLTALDGRQWRCKITLDDGFVVYSTVATTKLPE